LTRQVLSTQVLETWIALLRGHAELTRAMNARMVAEHGLTLNDFEVLMNLADAPERALRRVDLANRVVLSASGITRLLDGLERAGYVEKRSCDSDARVTYAQLTDAGFSKLQQVRCAHHDDVAEMFASHFSDDEVETLGELLGRLSSGRFCGVGGEAPADAQVAPLL
jgi:DNA-binding MarR family transcriptional regulator